MDKTHFTLKKRYKAILKDGSEVVLDLTPEDCYYFDSQEIAYLIRELRYSNIDINEVKEVVPFFVPRETDEEVDITIGL